MVRGLLMAQRSTEGDVGRWLAAMIARRSMEPNHLCEDLGLRERPELTRLLTRHFALLASRNTRNMKWKRFFYRMLCEDDGHVHDAGVHAMQRFCHLLRRGKRRKPNGGAPPWGDAAGSTWPESFIS